MTNRGLRYNRIEDMPQGMQQLVHKAGQVAPKRGPVEHQERAPVEKRPGLGRHAKHSVGEMNKTEARYAQYLNARKAAGEVDWWAFESVKLRLAKRAWFTVDFVVRYADGYIELHEVKGRKGERYWAEEDAKLKLKFAAESFPFWRMKVVWPGAGGAWREELF